MRKLILALGFGLISVATFAQKVAQTNEYQYFIDLTKVKDDKLSVELIVPKINESEVSFFMPKTVPGTYSADDYGRYLSGFEATTKKGKKLKFTKIGENTYKIKKANKLYKITYKLDDTWDSPEIEGKHIFEPSGSSFAPDKFYAVNTHTVMGYLTDRKKVAYNIKFVKPAGFLGTSSMTALKNSDTEEVYQMPDYQSLVDSPLLFCKPDTTHIDLNGTDILVSVYSPKRKANSKEIADNIKTMLMAQKDYLGGTLPVKKYAFLIVLADVGSGESYGALEHSYSSFYYLPEATAKRLSQTIKDVASHEFFHIVTPLNIHAEQIGNFDFADPQMSQHLWMYEGLTEYAAGHMQAKHSLIDLPKYLDMLRGKIISMKTRYSETLPFTEMSAKVLDTHKEEYNNVYEKGALIGLCLDIKLRELSKGAYGTQNLMRDLAKTYGKDVSFKDEELFDKIVSLTYPEIGDFLKKYVSGPSPLPISEFLEKVGIIYLESETKKDISLGNFALSYNPKSKMLVVKSVENLNEFGKKMGYQADDEIVSVNGEALNIETANDIITKFKANAKEGDILTIIVRRKDADGNAKDVTLSAPVMALEQTLSHVIRLDETPTDAQLNLRNQWLDPKKN
jgi:predicted metalloprotease with PDZ domain